MIILCINTTERFIRIITVIKNTTFFVASVKIKQNEIGIHHRLRL